MAKIATWADGISFTWAGAQATDNLIAPGTDTIMHLQEAEMVIVEIVTPTVAAGVATFDFHIISSVNGTDFSDNKFETIIDGAAENRRNIYALDLSKGYPKHVKVRMDLNTANMAEGEDVTVTFYPVPKNR